MLTTSKPSRPTTPCLAALLLGLWAGILTSCTPPGPRALLDGERLLQAGRPADAVKRLRTAVEFLPGNAQAWNHLGLAYHQAGQPGDAAAAYQQAIRLDRNLAVAYYNLGCLWLEQDNGARATEALRSHVALQPRSLDGWRKLGQAQLRTAQWDLADQSFRTALSLTPNDPESLNGLGIAFQQRQHAREAWQCFTAATTRNPSYAPAWLNLGVAAQRLGANDHAIQAYRHYVRLRPRASRALGVDDLLVSLEAPPPPAWESPTGTNTAALRPGQTSPPPESVVPSPRQLEAPPSPLVPTESAQGSPSRASRAPEARAEPETVSPTPVDPTNRRLASASPAPNTPSRATEAPSPTPSTSSPAGSPSAGPRRSPMATAPAPSLAMVTVPTVPNPPGAASLASPSSTSAKTNPALPEIPIPSRVASSDESRPLIRPISERTPPPDDNRGFWARANPANWFGAEAPPERAPESPATSPDEPAAADQPETSRWRWANPVRWFRSDAPPADSLAGSPGASDDSPASAAAESGPAGPPILTEPTIRVVSRPLEPVAAAPAAAAPTPTLRPPPPEFRRYQYLNPPTPASGNREAARTLISQAVLEHRRGRLDGAIDLYQRALQADPAAVGALQNLAAAYLEKGNLPQALAQSETALTLASNSAPTRLNFALALDRAGFPVDAATEAERVLARYPQDTGAHLLLGNLYAQQLERPDLARTHYLRVIELDPRHPQSIVIRRWLADTP